jgi:hypothetical protein
MAPRSVAELKRLRDQCQARLDKEKELLVLLTTKSQQDIVQKASFDLDDAEEALARAIKMKSPPSVAEEGQTMHDRRKRLRSQLSPDNLSESANAAPSHQQCPDVHESASKSLKPRAEDSVRRGFQSGMRQGGDSSRQNNGPGEYAHRSDIHTPTSDLEADEVVTIESDTESDGPEENSEDETEATGTVGTVSAAGGNAVLPDYAERKFLSHIIEKYQKYE